MQHLVNMGIKMTIHGKVFDLRFYAIFQLEREMQVGSLDNRQHYSYKVNL
ncbi:hypothetical protein VAE122_390002 [Vibrio aestuarianus]|nr:hypothetical protein VAE122_390002 [Vibrio aestuarianus]